MVRSQPVHKAHSIAVLLLLFLISLERFSCLDHKPNKFKNTNLGKWSLCIMTTCKASGATQCVSKIHVHGKCTAVVWINASYTLLLLLVVGWQWNQEIKAAVYCEIFSTLVIEYKAASNYGILAMNSYQ